MSVFKPSDPAGQCISPVSVSQKKLWVFLHFHRWSIAGLPLIINITGTHSWVERDTASAKCLAHDYVQYNDPGQGLNPDHPIQIPAGHC